jgi:hypothetical protein
VLAAAAACKVSTDLSRNIAIEVVARDSLEELDTLRPRAHVITGHGDSAATPVFWFSPDSAIRVLDSTTGTTVVAHTGGTGRLVARGGGLVSNPVLIRTLAAANTISAAGATADTVPAGDSLSDSLKVALADTIESSTGGDSLTVPLTGRPVVYVIAYPATAGPVTLVGSDTARALVTTDTVATGAAGFAFVKVRLLGPAAPDSVVVVASARRAVGTLVPGSPVTFTVRFAP